MDFIIKTKERKKFKNKCKLLFFSYWHLYLSKHKDSCLDFSYVLINMKLIFSKFFVFNIWGQSIEIVSERFLKIADEKFV